VAPLRPLEDHVFEEMRDAGHFGRLVARAGADEEADGDGTHGRVGFTDDLQAVFQNVTVEWHVDLLMRSIGSRIDKSGLRLH